MFDINLKSALLESVRLLKKHGYEPKKGAEDYTITQWIYDKYKIHVSVIPVIPAEPLNYSYQITRMLDGHRHQITSTEVFDNGSTALHKGISYALRIVDREQKQLTT